jgi:hexokinase
VEKISNVGTFIRTPETDKRPDRVIINTEWGAFGNNKCLRNFRTRWDDVLDAGSINPGKQIFEKMISGMYLGELVRLILRDAVKEGILFAGRKVPGAMDQKDVINAAFLSKCEEDEPNGPMEMTRQELEQSFHLKDVSLDECRAVRKLCERVSVRAANLTAAALTVLMERVWAHDRQKLAIGADGSLFQKHPRFKARVYAMMRLMLEGPQDNLRHFTIEEVNDASGVGAAITAACHNSGLVPTGNTAAWPDGRQKAKSITKSQWIPDPKNETRDPKRTGSGSDLRRSPH